MTSCFIDSTLIRSLSIIIFFVRFEVAEFAGNGGGRRGERGRKKFPKTRETEYLNCETERPGSQKRTGRHSRTRPKLQQKTASITRGGFAFLFSCILSFYSIMLTVTVLLPNLRASRQLGTQMSSSLPLTPPPVSETRYCPV